MALTNLQTIVDEASTGIICPRTASDRMFAVATLAVRVQDAITKMAAIAGVGCEEMLGQLREIADNAVEGVRRPAMAPERMQLVIVLAQATRAAIVEMAEVAKAESEA